MLTVKGIQKLEPGQKASDGGPRGSGALWVKRTTAGTLILTFRYSVNRRTIDMALGPYDEAGQAGMTLAEARTRAGELQRMIQSGIPDPRAWLEEQDRLKVEAEEARQKAQEAEQAARQREAMERERYTLRRLCEVYAGHLEARGKHQTAKHARSMFKVHVFEEAPDLADTPAREVTRRDLTGLIRRCNEKGHARAGGILRAYLSAAYALAVNAEGDSQAPSELLGFEVDSNPVQGVKAIPVQTSERALGKDEVRAYLSRLWGDNLTDRFLVLHLLTAGQRVSQLLRVRVSDYDTSEGTLRLQDPKGRRQVAREHILPLGPLGAELVEVLIDRAREQAAKVASRTGGEIDPNPSLWLSTGGASMTISTPGKRAGEIASDMKGLAFDIRDIRRSVETLLAGMGVNRDIRAQLLSHGLSGVQDKHYDRHGYIEEKRSALERWEGLLAEIAQGEERSNVVQMRRRKRA
jgi:integrase